MKKLQYVIRTCSSENTQELQNLLNEMSMDNWELYSMQETENEEGQIFTHCIFMRETDISFDNSNTDIINISSFKNQMEKMLSEKASPYQTCLEIQSKIRDEKARIAKIKKELEGEAPASVNRKKLNDKISAGLKELNDLKEKLAKDTSPNAMYNLLKEDKLSINLSEEILINKEFMEEELTAETVKLRLKLTEELGYIIPKIVFNDDENLNPYEFSIKIRGVEVLKSYTYPSYLMFFEDDIRLDKKIKNSQEDIDPITGKNIIWIEKEKAKNFWQKGISCSEFISRALEFCAIKYVDELLSYEDIEKYIEVVSAKNEFLISNIIPDYLSYPDLKFIITSLLKEKVSIKDITYIFEKINDFAEESSKSDFIKKIRLALSRRICKNYCNEEGIIQAIEISDKTLDKFMPNFDEDSIIRIDASFAETLAENLLIKIEKYKIDNPILIAPLEFRHLMFSLLSDYISNITVLAREEVGCYAKLDILSEI